MSAVHIDRDVKAFGGEHAIRMSNGEVELVATTDFGPRILGYAPAGAGGSVGGANTLGFLDPKIQAKETRFGEPWHIYGGHRLWHAPEHPVLSYVPDNAPVTVTLEGDAVVLSRPLEAETSLLKEMRITLAPKGSRAVIEHRITNKGSAEMRLAVWALTMMAPGGQAIFPNPPFVPYPEGLLPVGRLVLWPYTQLADPRFRLGARYLRLAHDANAKAPQKVGLFDEANGWAAYAGKDWLFVKRYLPAAADAALVDLGCNVETFSDAGLIEVETLGPEVRLRPGGTTSHREAWHLFTGVTLPADDDAAHEVLAPLLRQTQAP